MPFESTQDVNGNLNLAIFGELCSIKNAFLVYFLEVNSIHCNSLLILGIRRYIKYDFVKSR